MLPTTASPIRKDSNVIRVLPNFAVLGTLGWLVGSLLAIATGIYHCRANGFNYLILCEQATNACVLTSTRSDIAPLKLDRGDIADVRMVRLDKDNQIVDTNGMRARQMTRFGSTLQIVYRRRAGQRIDADGHALPEQDHELAQQQQHGEMTILFPPLDMGGNNRHAKSAKRRLDEFLAGREERVQVSSGRVVTVLGLLGILGGFFSSLLSCFIGVWADAPSTRKSRKRRD